MTAGNSNRRRNGAKKNRDMKSPPKLAVSEGIFMSLQIVGITRLVSKQYQAAVDRLKNPAIA